MNLAELEDETLLAWLRDLLDATAPSAQRSIIGRICGELRRRGVSLSEMPAQAPPAAATCPACLESEDSLGDTGELNKGMPAPGSAKSVAPAGGTSGGRARTSMAAAEPVATSGPSRNRGLSARPGGNLRQEVASLRAELADVVATVGRLANVVLTVARGVGFAEVPLRDLHNEIEDENLVDGIAERVRNVERMMRASRDWQGRTGAVVAYISEGLG